MLRTDKHWRGRTCSCSAALCCLREQNPCAGGRRAVEAAEPFHGRFSPQTRCGEACFSALQKFRLMHAEDKCLRLSRAPRGLIGDVFLTCSFVTVLSGLRLTSYQQLCPLPQPRWVCSPPRRGAAGAGAPRLPSALRRQMLSENEDKTK